MARSIGGESCFGACAEEFSLCRLRRQFLAQQNSSARTARGASLARFAAPQASQPPNNDRHRNGDLPRLRRAFLRPLLDDPAKQIDQLLPWNWKAAKEAQRAQAQKAASAPTHVPV